MQTLEKRPEISRHTGPAADSAALLIVDARMLFSSGIGRYLREILSRWPKGAAAAETYLCNHESQIEWLASHRPGASIRRSTAGIYSLGEQMQAMRLPRGNLLWVPHYNLPWFSRPEVIATVHDAAPLVLREIFSRPAQRLAARFYFRAARHTTRRVISVSNFTARELSHAAGIPSSRIDVIPNGVGPEWFPSNPSHERPACKLLFVGNLKPHKNLRRLLLALQTLHERGRTSLELDIVGQVGGFRTELDSTTSGLLQNTSWIRVHGSASDEQLRALYASSGALVFPSLYEGFGLPMLEAMASGCPVLSSNAASLPEIGGPAQHQGGAVAYFNPDNIETIAAAIDAFIHLSAEKRRAMSAAGPLRARLFSWDDTARRTREILTTHARALSQ